MKRFVVTLLTAAAVTCLLRADNNAILDTIRRGDTNALKRGLASGFNPNTKDDEGATALMHAAAYASAGDVRLLLEAGADVNAASAYGSTALMWAAGDPEKVKLLLERGAASNARALDRSTPLLIAARLGSAESMRLLVRRGADPKATSSDVANLLRVAYNSEYSDVRRVLSENGVSLTDARNLGAASLAQNLDDLATFRQLLDAGADPKQTVTIVTLTLPTIGLAASSGRIDAVRMLLDRGANGGASGTHGWTPLMMAAAASRPNPSVVALLLERGVEVNARDEAGRTALDWALMQGETVVAGQLRKAGGKALAPAVPAPSPVLAPLRARLAIEKAVARLQPASPGFTRETTCFSCHNQSLPSIAVKLAAVRGVPVDRALAAHPTEATLEIWKRSREQFLLGNVPGGGFVAGTPYSLVAMAEEGVAPNPITDAVAVALANVQRSDGSWNLPVGQAGGGLRPPLGNIGSITLTALSIRGLSVYMPPGRQADFKDRLTQAREFLRHSKPFDTQDDAFKLLGLVWSGAAPAEIQEQAKHVLALQRADGGFAQLPTMSPDAYATGQALFALQAGGVSPHSEAYRKGAEYLLRTQLEDGTWLVHSRGFGFQPYFESGFPHGRDQFISAAATAWAAIALAYTL